MATGTLKMWNADRGFGFIKDDSGGPDIFLHVSALQSASIDPDNLKLGERLTFDGRIMAGSVRRATVK
jgi:cold shock protein